MGYEDQCRQFNIYGKVMKPRSDGYLQYQAPEHSKHNRLFHIYDNHGTKVGISKVILYSSMHFSQHFERHGYDIYDPKKEQFKGRVIEEFQTKPIDPAPASPIKVRFRALFHSKLKTIYDMEMNITSINAVDHIDIEEGFHIDLHHLSSCLRQNGHFAFYFDTIHHAMKFVYHLNDFEDGKCRCSGTCTCKQMHVMVFDNGKMIFSGCKSFELLECMSHEVRLYIPDSLRSQGVIRGGLFQDPIHKAFCDEWYD